MNRILLEAAEMGDSGEVLLQGRRAEHVIKVLRAVPGDNVRIGVINGPVGTARIDTVQPDRVQVTCTLDTRVPSRSPVSVLLAMPRPRAMNRLWPQLAAMGVDKILLTNARRVERTYFDSHVLAPTFARERLLDGLEQAGDTCLPEVQIHRRFKVVVQDHLEGEFASARRLLAHPIRAQTIHQAVVPGSQVLLAVGPEGGWIDYETDLLQQHGFQPVSMGHRTLRTDTACIALLALVHDALEHRVADHDADHLSED